MKSFLNDRALGRFRLGAFYILIIFSLVNIEHAEAKVFTVKVTDMKFDPPSLTVNTGDTVIWENLDIFPHTVSTTEKNKPKIESGTVPPGKSFSVKFSRTGSVAYFCRFHPVMIGSITIAK